MKTMSKSNAMAVLMCAGALAAGITAYSPSAEACGGLFCNNSQPVNQAAERIIFSDNPDDTVTAIVQIMYQGPSERFAWVLPVPGSPEVGVSSGQAFDRLQQATNPSYRMNTTVEGTCDTSGRGMFGGADESAANDGGSMNNGGVGGVEVVDSGHVGPYDYTTISVAEGSDDPASEALDWLGQNNYDVSALGEQTIRPYLEDGMNLLAFRLSKDADTGDIRPVRITYDAELPMIPIKLTAVAANDDMGVMTWILGEDRAVPANYKSLRLNEAAIDWFNPNNNYNDVVNRAADEANGQGFVTEFAGPTSDPIPAPNQFGAPSEPSELIFGPSEQNNWRAIETGSWTSREGELLGRALNSYRGWDGFLEVIEATVPLSEGTTAEDFVNCRTPACDSLTQQSDITDFDPETFVSQLEMQVVEPMRAVQDLIDERAYMTRLYTTMSAADMTLDPVFEVNAGLDDHPNVHIAEQVIECGDEDYTRAEAPWRLELPQGDTIYGSGTSWPVDSEDEMPANHMIVQDRNTGQGEVVVDNSPQIEAFISEHNEQVTDEFSGGVGCQVTEPGAASLARNLSLALMFGAFGLLLVRVRRRD